MIKIENPQIFAKCVADALVTIDENTALNTGEKLRAVNAVSKAVTRIEADGCFMDYDGDARRLVIWSQGSNMVYELGITNRCGCYAELSGVICWHKAAKRLIEKYNAAMLLALASDYVARRSVICGLPKTAIVEQLQPHEMPYLQPTDNRSLESYGGVRI